MRPRRRKRARPTARPKRRLESRHQRSDGDEPGSPASRSRCPKPTSTTSSPKPGEPARFGLSLARQRRLPRGRRRLGERLPRVLHDPRRQTRAADRIPCWAKWRGSRKTASSSTATAAPATAPSSPRRPPASARRRPALPSSTSTRPTCGPTPYEDQPNPSFPNGSRLRRVEDPAQTGRIRNLAERLRHDPLRPLDRGRPEHRRRPTPPSGATVTVNLPEVKNPTTDETSQGSSQVRSAEVTLPAGMGLNPSAANGLDACTDDQFNKGSREAGRLPARVADRHGRGRHAAASRRLAERAGLRRQAAQPRSRPPATSTGSSSTPSRAATTSRRACSARSSADPQTGQLTTIFDDKALGSIPLRACRRCRSSPSG